ncbi:MAG: hydroxymethylbilane synthase [Candidatus Acidiferrales bacterium]
MRLLSIGSRGSALALWQAEHVRRLLRERVGADATIVVIKTTGDRAVNLPFGQVGTKGMFLKELEDALLDGRVDLAVHSLKDVPTDPLPAGLTLAAFLEREDVRDALVSRSGARLDALPPGARVGTSSLRRQSQLRHYRADLGVAELRGNVDTRLGKLDRGDYDAIVLAKAGLDRLGLSQRITEILPVEISLPAAGQGALTIEARVDDAEIIGRLRKLDHAETRACVEAERALLAGLGGGCQIPIGAWARIEPRAGASDQMKLDAVVLSPDGSDCLRRRTAGRADRPEELGRNLAAAMIADGADRILAGRRQSQAEKAP